MPSDSRGRSPVNHAAFCLLLAVILVLTACTSPAPIRTPAPTAAQLPNTAVAIASSTPAGVPATPTAPPAPTATAAPPALKVGYAADAQGTPNVLEEVQGLAQQLGWEVVPDTSGLTAITALAQAGAQIVVADGAALEAATRQAASAFPQTYFIGVNQTGTGDDLPNLLVLGGGPSREDQLGFMAGVVAGFASQAQVVTAVGYTGTPAGLKYRNGFLHGVRYSCSRCRIDFVDAVDLNSDAAAVERARLNASISSDVVFAAAGATGIRSAARGGHAGRLVNRLGRRCLSD